MHRLWVLVVILVACGGGQHANQAAPVAAAPTSQCPRVADHVIDLMSGRAKDAPPAKIKEVHDTIAEHCEGDKWSADAQQCLLKVTTMHDGEACAQMLTQGQRDAIDQAMDAAALPPTPPPAPMAEPAPMPLTTPPAPSQKPKRSPKKGGDPCEGGE